jgi:phosphatidate cytidylyltransferase
LLKTRVISAIIGLALLIGVVLLGREAFGLAVFIIALAGMNEYYDSVSNAGYRPIRILGYITCLPIAFIGIYGNLDALQGYIELFKSINYFSFALYAIVVALFSSAVFFHDRYNPVDIALTVLGMIYVSFLFSFIVLTRNLVNGGYYIWLIFIGAWATDTAAYFTGRFFGKIKMLPAVSPNKTLEGSIGGVVGSLLATVLYGLILNNAGYIGVIPIYHFMIIGILSGIISQLGDWTASAIKRYTKIKDYGKLFPGHGGVLDRFDSIIFIAPLIYFYISFFILK